MILQRLGEAESGLLTKEEFNKMKQELEAEYLATFKKTVAQHEVSITISSPFHLNQPSGLPPATGEPSLS